MFLFSLLFHKQSVILNIHQPWLFITVCGTVYVKTVLDWTFVNLMLSWVRLTTLFDFLHFVTISAIVYKYGLIAELIGKTTDTNHANAAGDNVITLIWTKLPNTIIGNQHRKSVATINATLDVSLICSFISKLRPELFVDFLAVLIISM